MKNVPSLKKLVPMHRVLTGTQSLHIVVARIDDFYGMVRMRGFDQTDAEVALLATDVGVWGLIPSPPGSGDNALLVVLTTPHKEFYFPTPSDFAKLFAAARKYKAAALLPLLRSLEDSPGHVVQLTLTSDGKLNAPQMPHAETTELRCCA